MKANFDVLLDVVTRRRLPDFVPPYEYFVDDPIIAEVMGYDFSKTDWSTIDGQLEYWKKKINFYEQMGYVHFSMEFGPRFAGTTKLVTDDTAIYKMAKRGWVDEHNGPIRTMEDVENPEYWPDIDNVFDYEMFEKISKLLPEGMKITGGCSGGPFEHASFLMGLENLCVAIYEDEEMVDKLFERIGSAITGVAERLVKLDNVGIYRFGDDLGYKNGTMLSPVMLRKYVFPWYKKIADITHKAGKPFMLHSCGQLELVMDDIIEAGVDAKHSFEDVIMPVTEAKKRWGDRIAIIGGIDVDFLCRHSPSEIKEHTKRVMDACSKGGGYAIGSGNTIANYIPLKNYLALMEAISEYNGQ